MLLTWEKQKMDSVYNASFGSKSGISLSRTVDIPDFNLHLPNNRLYFTYGGPTLIVSFDNAGAPHREPYDRLPWGHKFLTSEGHSVLGVIAGGSDWYRDNALREKLDELKEDGFFRLFDKVVMTGSSMGGFGATAFAPLSPGCHVIAFNPQSTLRHDLVPWETDHKNGRRQDWSGSYSDGAVGLSSSSVGYIIFDPFVRPDRLHAERFAHANVKHLKAPFLGHGLPDSFLKLGLLKEIMRRGINGNLTNQWFSQAIRSRRDLRKYRKEIISAMARHMHADFGLKFSRLAYEVDPDFYFLYYEAIFVAGSGRMREAGEILDRIDKSKRRSLRNGKGRGR